jgi:hypothetical protein
MTFEQLSQKKIDFIPNSGNREQVLTINFIINGLCHEDRWEVFFHHVVKDHIWVHWPTIYPWLKNMPLRGNEFWLAREFINLWEQDVIRSLPEDCGDAELPAILAFKEKYAPKIQVIVGTVDEWLQLRQKLPLEDMAF